MSKTPKLTDADVVNLIDCAGSGIAYWAASGHVDEAAKTYRVIESSVELAEGDAPADKTMTFDDLRKAFVALAAAGTLPDWQMREIEEDDLGFDATVGDLVVQRAMFGEIVFG
ncbi:hypothetical protein [Cryobacterium zhongshanensis]|uniref:Uncharacterized protein n=1 Tax=Cryobacterium zhongshanensis TaxID=2928153 RepID=A0AA41QWR4_9MICO|nr:hypothetical protein [Cryobacterium zhongshanensis]MCI4659545.1 hypothetical protein [Cryobacterium zhongshanensis]